MCIIVDANVANEFAARSIDAAPVLKKVVDGNLRMVCDHDLKKEWLRTRLGKLYRQLQLAGKIVEYSHEQTKTGIAIVKRMQLKSDDPHVIALARVSGARILFSRDIRLHEDFKNLTLIPDIKGKVYQFCRHRRLLEEGICSCH